MNSICIGIISYLPDKEDIRKERCLRVSKLINQLDTHFNLPIILIAQNYKDFNIDSNNIIRYDFDKLGITGARIKLREKFLESDFDYVIMFDDDMELSDNQEDYDKYINDVIKNKKEHYKIGNFLINFCTMSKQGFRKLNFDSSVDAEKGTGFEDWIFAEKCIKALDSMNLQSNLPKYPRKHFLNDKYSTWDDGKLQKINERNSLPKVRQARSMGKIKTTDIVEDIVKEVNQLI